ncbi:unnamed protein product [Macrosiphum euphorbiae]|uniref:Phage integrase SAM-like domain-containing protein n=1 Tax=Macrosiphum euphorbiae TaxID=13131 RepID=A0AAV0Y466_9HEMI|nr:unnamed protein product [Macrosiphum euphorbiae]
MFRNTPSLSHGEESSAADNYIANISRVLMYVHQHLVDTKFPPRHWSDLVSTDVQPYMEYIRRREELDQTKATTINYLKNIRLLFSYVIRAYVYEDPSFPVSFDQSPCSETITRIKLLDQKLELVYKRTTKQQPQELFSRKTQEARTMPQYSDVVKCIGQIAQALQHSDRTAGQYYRLPDAKEALRRNNNIQVVDYTAMVKSYVDKNFEDMFPLQTYAKFNCDDWLTRKRESDVCREFPSAKIDSHYVNQLGERFDFAVLQGRCDILLQGVIRAGYNKNNISEHAIVDVAKQRKIGYFLRDVRCRKKIVAKIKAAV